MGKIKVFVDNIGEISIDKGATLEDISNLVYKNDYKKYLGAKIENEVFHLRTVAKDGQKIKFIDITDVDGHRIYTRTLGLIYITVCEEMFPGYNVNIEHSLGEGFYTELSDKRTISFSEIEKIKKRMLEIIEADVPIEREKINRMDALKIFKEKGYEDKFKLYSHVEKDEIHIYKILNHIDSFYGYVAPSTGYVKIFDLKYYYPGAILLSPNQQNQTTIPEFVEQRKLAKVFKEAEDWADILDLGYLGSLNDKIMDGSIDEVIRVSEALHEKKIASFADEICKDESINLIMIAGPSSSGKTTFAQRLGVQLKVNGKRPISISIDDYFVDREDTPKNEYGEYDFEALEAIDLKRLNKDLISLLEGSEVELPVYNFISGRSEPSGIKVKVDEDHPIIVEGLHALNPNLTSSIPEKNKYKIYVSALTQLNIDAHNRIPTTDTRILRRIVRDSKFRGNDIERTFKLWELVRVGEEKNIFPYQEEADAMFDSSLVYELTVLKKYVAPLLKEVDRESIYYSEAKRLLKFLNYFKDVEDESIIPPTSILREFIGGSSFKKR
ncbi:nucleoside kinase [Sporanaerobacter acetigenes]|uniref:Uridine kinase n=1 Tax=Sporanaerobacter acetigenes DSM 13106 TaxID=1123281 RepID=A0A1M5WKG3_9FIRM|nr:nucleoside kinase [Sporanaerobacter acetigenes]SHH87664.1 uridine kinase [Sporanaerobacter acetigenes DSM 13106]